MARPIKLDRDIKPSSELRANAAELIDHIRTSGRPLVLTQNRVSILTVRIAPPLGRSEIDDRDA